MINKEFLKNNFAIIISIVLLLAGIFLSNLNIQLFSFIPLYIGNFLWFLHHKHERFIYIAFISSIYFFLLGRNIMEMIQGIDWTWRFSYEILSGSLIIIFIMLIVISCGAQYVSCKKIHFIKSSKYDKKNQIIRKLSFIFMLIFFVCLIITEIDKLIFMHNRPYYEYYSLYKPSIPSVIVSLSALFKYSFFLFLATLPNKKMTIISFMLFFISKVPVFIIGQRNPLISSIALFVVYFVYRDSENSHNRWIKLNKKKIFLIICFSILLLSFLSMYELIRYNKPIQGFNPISSMFKLIETQGYSFDVICYGISNINILPKTNFCYTIGPLINYLMGNTLAQFIFNTPTFSGSTLEYALYGNNLDRTLSYIVLGEKYFKGAGVGSSFILESYIDFGFIGIVIIGFIIGVLLIYIVKLLNKNIWTRYFSIIALSSIFMLARSTTTSWMTTLIYFPMFIWLFLLICLTNFILKGNQLLMSRFFRKSIEFVTPLLSIINYMIPKYNKQILFFDSKEVYLNNYALLQYMIRNNYNTDYKIYFSMPIQDKEIINNLTKNNIMIVNGLLKTLLLFFQSKNVFLDTGSLRIRPSQNQNVINLWHGSPLKCIGFMSKSVEKDLPKNKMNTYSKICVAHQNFNDIYMKSFNLKNDQILINGQPRLDLLDKNSKNKFISHLHIDTQKYKKIFMWMTTYRISYDGRLNHAQSGWSSTNLPILTTLEQIDTLNMWLSKKDILIIVKIHHGSVFDEIDNMSNIIFIKDKDYIHFCQLYNLLSDVDALITDYSSVYFDYLLLDRPIGFIIDDFDEYNKLNGFTFDDPLSKMPGYKIKNYDDLIVFLENELNNIDDFKDERKKINDEFNFYKDHSNCKRILDYCGVKK